MSDRSLLPPNATAHETVLEAAIRPDVPIEIREIWNPDTCPHELLPWLARAFSVDAWESDWTEEQKRHSVKASIEVHRHKGTIGSVRTALGALGIDARVQEWFNQVPTGEPYTFDLRLAADQTPVDQAGMKAALALVMNMKNLRSHLDEIQVSARSESRLRVGAVARMGQQITVINFRPVVLVINELAIVLE